MPAYDIAIVGSGPGGYVAAIRAAQLGMKTVIVERDQVGGLCLNWGCIPSKALLYCAEVVNLFGRAGEFGIHQDGFTPDLGLAVDRSRRIVKQFVSGVETLLQQNKAEVVSGSASLTSPTSLQLSGQPQEISAANIILATGGRPRGLPGLEPDAESVISSREALALREPPTSIVIVGGGPIGVEFAYLYRTYGSEVTIVEALPHLLPGEDADVSRQLERSLKAQGVNLRLGTTVESVSVSDAEVQVSLGSGSDSEEISAEKVLVGIGFAGNIESLALERAGVVTERGFVAIDDLGRTSAATVWAVGDVTGKLPLAHVASHQGITVVEAIAGLDPPPLNYLRMPRAVYSQPQVVSLGLTEEAARSAGHEISSGRFPLRANGKAVASGATEGFAKVVSDANSREILGYHAIGHNVTELLAEATAAGALQATDLQIGSAVHAHPTLSEALKEAALSASSEAIHFFTSRRS